MFGNQFTILFLLVGCLLGSSVKALPQADTPVRDSIYYQQYDSLYWAGWQQLGYNAKKALQTSQRYLRLCQTRNDSQELGYGYDLVGLSHYYLNNIDSALVFQKKALATFKAMGDSAGISQALVNLGLTYSYSGNLEGAINSYRQSYHIDTLLGDGSGKMFYNNNIGTILLEQGELKLAEKYLRKALAESHNDTFYDYIHPSIYINLGDVLIRKGKLQAAEDTLKISMRMARDIEDNLGIASALSFLAEIELKRNNYEKALHYNRQSFVLDSSFGDPYSQAYDLEFFAQIYRAKGNLEKALYYAEKARTIADSENVMLLSRDVYKIYGEILEVTGQYEKALEAFKYYQELDDTLGNINAHARILELDAKVAQKQLAVANANSLLQEKELERKNTLILVFIIFLVIVATVTLLLARARSKIKDFNNLLLKRNQQIFDKQNELDRKSKELEKNNTKLRKLNTSKDRLFSVLAHDLKQPFNQILAVIELLDSDAIPKFEEMELRKNLRESVQSTSELVNNMLLWSKAQFAGITLRPGSVNLSTIVKKQILQMSVALEKKKIRVEVSIDRQLQVYFDADHLGIILRNLIHNAYKFSSENSRIVVKGEVIDESSARVMIQDFGVGMNEEQVERLLHTFETESTSGTLQETGTGLGMVIVKEFLRENGGKMEIESAAEKGTTFKLILPLTVNKEKAPPQDAETTFSNH